MKSNSSSATTGANSFRWAALFALSAATGCPRVEVGGGVGLPSAETAEPVVRVAIGLPQREVTIGGAAGLLVSSSDGGGLAQFPAGAAATLTGSGTTVRAAIGGISTASGTVLTVQPLDSVGLVRVNGRDYRGSLLVTSTSTGILVVNLLSVEAYVAGVVNAEMGRRAPADSEAVYAQAVISRTVAMRALGRYRIRGYDVVSTVSDQAYGGVATETEMGWAAVRATRGQALTFGGSVIEAFFHSTCGGRTEAVDQVFSGAPQPYLQSVSDRGPSGEIYCAISPRFRWREEWTGEQVTKVVRENAKFVGVAPDAIGVAADLQLAGRSPSGRAAELVLVAGGRPVPIAGQQAIRQVLRLADGGWLRSTQFSIQVTRTGGRLVRLALEGGGNGHGVGMCQWGAVGRARAGAAYQEILSVYFPGTDLRRLY